MKSLSIILLMFLLTILPVLGITLDEAAFLKTCNEVKKEAQTITQKLERLNQLGESNLDEQKKLFDEIAEHYKRVIKYCKKALKKVKKTKAKKDIKTAKIALKIFQKKAVEFRQNAAKRIFAVSQYKVAIGFFNQEFEKSKTLYQLGINKSIQLQNGDVTDEIERAQLLEERANLFEFSVTHCQNALNHVLTVNARHEIDQAKKQLDQVRVQALIARKESNQWMMEIHEKLLNLENKKIGLLSLLLTLIKEENWLGINDIRQKLILLYEELISYHKRIFKDLGLYHYWSAQPLTIPNMLEFEANKFLQVLKLNDEKNKWIELKHRYASIVYFKRAARSREVLLAADLNQKDKINQLLNNANEQKNMVDVISREIGFEIEFNNELKSLLKRLSLNSIAKDKQLDLLEQLYQHATMVNNYYEIIENKEKAFIWNYWIHFSKEMQLVLDADIYFDEAEEELKNGNEEQAAKKFSIGSKELLSSRNEFEICKAFEGRQQSLEEKVLRERIEAIEVRFSTLSQDFHGIEID